MDEQNRVEEVKEKKVDEIKSKGINGFIKRNSKIFIILIIGSIIFILIFSISFSNKIDFSKKSSDEVYEPLKKSVDSSEEIHEMYNKWSEEMIKNPMYKSMKNQIYTEEFCNQLKKNRRVQ